MGKRSSALRTVRVLAGPVRRRRPPRHSHRAGHGPAERHLLQLPPTAPPPAVNDVSLTIPLAKLVAGPYRPDDGIITLGRHRHAALRPRRQVRPHRHPPPVRPRHPGAPHYSRRQHHPPARPAAPSTASRPGIHTNGPHPRNRHASRSLTCECTPGRACTPSHPWGCRPGHRQDSAAQLPPVEAECRRGSRQSGRQHSRRVLVIQ